MLKNDKHPSESDPFAHGLGSYIQNLFLWMSANHPNLYFFQNNSISSIIMANAIVAPCVILTWPGLCLLSLKLKFSTIEFIVLGILLHYRVASYVCI